MRLVVPVGARVHLPAAAWDRRTDRAPPHDPLDVQHYRSDRAYVLGLSWAAAGGPDAPFPTSDLAPPMLARSWWHDQNVARAAPFDYRLGTLVRPTTAFDERTVGDSACRAGIHWFDSIAAAEWFARTFVEPSLRLKGAL